MSSSRLFVVDGGKPNCSQGNDREREREESEGEREGKHFFGSCMAGLEDQLGRASVRVSWDTHALQHEGIRVMKLAYRRTSTTLRALRPHPK